MTTVQQPTIDHDKVMAFVLRAVDELGGALNCSLVVMGDRLGYYRTLADHGPTTAEELARLTDTDPRHTREWLHAQAAGGYLEYDATTGRFTLPPEHAVALVDEDSPAYLPGFFQIVQGTIHDAPTVIDRAANRQGYGWDEHDEDVHIGCERFFRPGYNANLVESWLPALDGVVEKLRQGATVADVGCGLGASTVLMAQAFPASTFVGFDYHQDSVDLAGTRAAAAGVADRVRFERSDARAIPGGDYDLVTMFDCLHDMGDPEGAARRVRDVLAPDGTWLLVEPIAGDRVEDNFNVVGRAYYAFSALLCTPCSLAQDVGLALGTQAGQARLTELINRAGFGSVRRVAETPFNMVLEVRR
jgi:SAM-dependent methyltransferase